jgi:hypothetical protein
MEDYNRSRARKVMVLVTALASSLGVVGCSKTFGSGTILTPRDKCMPVSTTVELLEGSGGLMIGAGDLSVSSSLDKPAVDALAVSYNSESDRIVFDYSQESTDGKGALLTYGGVSVGLKDEKDADTGDSLFYVNLPKSTDDEPHVVIAQENGDGSGEAGKVSISIERSESGGAKVTVSTECPEEKKSGDS